MPPLMNPKTPPGVSKKVKCYIGMTIKLCSSSTEQTETHLTKIVQHSTGSWYGKTYLSREIERGNKFIISKFGLMSHVFHYYVQKNLHKWHPQAPTKFVPLIESCHLWSTYSV